MQDDHRFLEDPVQEVSGGALNYLYGMDADALLGDGAQESLERVCEYLATATWDDPELKGASRAGFQTVKVIIKIREIKNLLEEIDVLGGDGYNSGSLRAIWRAIEWELSNDSNHESTEKEIRLYWEAIQ